MKITYNQNPLCTTIELDDAEKELFKLKIRLKELEDLMFSGHFHLNPDDSFYDPVKAAEALDPKYWLTEEGPTVLDIRVQTLFDHYLAELMGSHCGDCTCVACSCEKCHAEMILGIDTISGLDKHSAYKIDSAIKSGLTIELAIKSLENYNPPRPIDESKWDQVGGFDQYIPRWKAEAWQAAGWLRKYCNEHFPEQRAI